MGLKRLNGTRAMRLIQITNPLFAQWQQTVNNKFGT